MQSLLSLAGYLRDLTEQQLADLISVRQDIALDPAPTTVDHLARRLVEPSSMAGACSLLSLPQLQVAEAAAALGDGFGAGRLAALMGVPEDDEDLAAALHQLTRLAMIWPYGDGLAAGHLNAVFPYPLDLGPAAETLLRARTVPDLRVLAEAYGIGGTTTSKRDLIRAVTEWLARPENVRELVARAPANVRRGLAVLASRPVYDYTTPGPVLSWALQYGLMAGTGWGSAEMPREVALALREDYTAPFDPVPPALPLTPISPDDAEREASAVATETLAAVTAVVEAVGKAPVPLLKTGGLGVREIRRIAKSSSLDEDRTRLVIEILVAEGMIDVSHEGLVPAASYDLYADGEPAAQLITMIDGWLRLPASPFASPDARALQWDEQEEMLLTALRAVILHALTGDVPEGQAADRDALAARLSWQKPVLADLAGEDLDRYVAGIWREAHHLGLLAHGTATRLTRSMMALDVDAMYGHAEAMLPRRQGTVVLQNDLTAVVPGTPTAALLALLDGAASPESRSGAWTWRFSPDSVRAALDAGNDPAELLSRITEVAEGGRVPQTLAYLIDDVARRYGRLQVRPAGCCLSSDDETLLTEILNTRVLGALKLVRLAPTVLISAKSPADTLAALRSAGYAPAALRADGAPAVEIPKRRRADPPHAHAEGFRPPAARTPADLARILVRAEN